MNDEEYFEQLCSNSVDGTLTDSEREKLEAHLAECPSCAALLRDLREMRALFAQEAEAPDSLHDGIMEQLRQETKLHVVQPEKPVRRMPVFTMVGVAAAVVLGVGRAIGEAMAVMMVSGNAPNMPGSIFESVRFLTTAVASEMSYSSGLQRQALFSIALVLYLFILLINAALNFFLKRDKEGN